MAKKRQTTGMPRKDRQKGDTPENPSLIDNLLGNPTNRAEREDALNRLIQGAIAAIVGVIVVIIVGVLVYSLLVVPLLTVATVNGERITVKQFRDRVDFEYALTLQNYNIRYNQLQQQAQIYGMDVNDIAQQDQQLARMVQELNSPDILGNRVIDDMVDDLLIKQEFEALGLSLDDTEIENTRQDFFGFDPTQVALIGVEPTETLVPTDAPTQLVSPTPSSTPAPTLTPTIVPSPTLDPEATAEATEVAEVTEVATALPLPTTSQTEVFENYEESIDAFEQNVIDSDVPRSSLEAFWERQAIRSAVLEAIVGEIDVTLYADARHILVETEDEATEIMTALQAGESFALLAQARSSDTGSGQRGGELGWTPVDLYVPEFAEAVRNGEIGVLLDPVESEFGFHIIQVIAKEDREVSEQDLLNLEQSRFGNWVEDQRTEAEDAENISINSNWPDLLG